MVGRAVFFKIERGVRQGCPLSSSLFILSVEILAKAFRRNRNIKGIFVNHGEVKLSQYADDTTLRADVCKYRPEAYNKENIKILKKIHKVALGELLTEIYFLLRSDNCFRRTEVVFVSQLSDLAFRVSHSASRKAR